MAVAAGLAAAFLLGYLATCVLVSQPYSPPECECGLPRDHSVVYDRPLLSEQQKEFARQRGYVVLDIGGINTFIVNPPEEYL